MGKLGYRKSRNGCTLCKQRHVKVDKAKCDELRPCTACQKHGVECSLVTQPPITGEGSAHPNTRSNDRIVPVFVPPGRRKRGRPRKNHGQVQSQNRGSASTLTEQSATLELDSPGRFGSHWVTELELMHQYNTVTHTTLPLPPQVKHTYNTDLVHLGFRYQYLLHHILALSAYHLAFLHPDSAHRYRLAGSVHQGHAINGMREALEAEMTEESGPALFASGGFLMATAYASLDRDDTKDDPDQFQALITDMLNVISLQRGVHSMQRTAVQQSLSDPVDVLLSESPNRVDVIDPDMYIIRSKLVELRDLLLSPSLGVGRSLEVDPAVVGGLTALFDAMDPQVPSKLTTGPTLRGRGPALRSVFLWPRVISDEFIELVRRHDEGALTVTLFFCVVLGAVEDECWFFTGWPWRLGRAIAHLLDGTEWVELARWPLERLRVTGSPGAPPFFHEDAVYPTQGADSYL